MSRDFHSPTSELDAKDQAIIDMVLSDKGGSMSIGQVANLFNAETKAVMQAISTSWRNESAREGV